MRSTKRSLAAATLAIAAALCGCAINPAPTNFLPEPATAARSTRGGWLDLQLRDSISNVQVAVGGELLAVTGDSLWMQTPTWPAKGFVVPRGMAKGDLIRFDYSTSQSAITGFTVVGVVSTISNGFALLLTAPLWVVTGTVGAVADSYAARTSVTARDETAEAQLRAFSRFPLGIPRGFDSAFVRLPCVGKEWPCFPPPGGR